MNPTDTVSDDRSDCFPNLSFPICGWCLAAGFVLGAMSVWLGQ